MGFMQVSLVTVATRIALGLLKNLKVDLFSLFCVYIYLLNHCQVTVQFKCLIPLLYIILERVFF